MTVFLFGDEEHRNIFILPPDDHAQPGVDAEISQSGMLSHARPEEDGGTV